MSTSAARTSGPPRHPSPVRVEAPRGGSPMRPERRTGDGRRTRDGRRAHARGRARDFFYHGGFDARAETKHVIVDEGIAVLEADFVGRHIGEFAGVPATGKDVRVPLAVIYDVRDDRIVDGRVYFEIPAFLAQISDG